MKGICGRHPVGHHQRNRSDAAARGLQIQAGFSGRTLKKVT